MRFDFATSGKILFGAGRAAEAATEARALGLRPLLVTGANPARAADIRETLRPVAEISVPGEPTVDLAQSIAAIARDARCDVVVSVGGGSVIDAGKAAAALLANHGEAIEYLEVIGAGRPLARAPLPHVSVPTTAGTGAEATRNAVLGSPTHGVKVSMRHPLMLPTVAIVDSSMTAGAPAPVVAAAGLDALTQLLEAFVTPFANPMTDALCREGLLRAGRSIRKIVDAPDDEARADMSLAALFSGIALSNARLGAVHGFAGPLGGMTGAAHGALCAALLPAVVEANIRALESRAPASASLARMDEVARLLMNDGNASRAQLPSWLRQLVDDLAIPTLEVLGLSSARHAEAADKARVASSMKGNPIELSTDELLAIVAAS
jgi:alcohol dehydrogenase class IV